MRRFLHFRSAINALWMALARVCVRNVRLWIRIGSAHAVDLMHFNFVIASQSLAVVIPIDEVDCYAKLAFALNQLSIVVAVSSHWEEGRGRFVHRHNRYPAFAMNRGLRLAGLRNDDFERAMWWHRRADHAQIAKQAPTLVDWFAIQESFLPRRVKNV